MFIIILSVETRKNKPIKEKCEDVYYNFISA